MLFPKLRMGLNYAACIHRLIEWRFRRDQAFMEGKVKSYKTFEPHYLSARTLN
jgi:hypothetical protein